MTRLFLEPQAQFLPNPDGLDYKPIVPSLRDFSFSGNNFSFGFTLASPKGYLTIVNGPDRTHQKNMGGGEFFDGGDTQEPVLVQDFFSSDRANQDGHTPVIVIMEVMMISIGVIRTGL